MNSTMPLAGKELAQYGDFKQMSTKKVRKVSMSLQAVLVDAIAVNRE